jgi:hypothetical protein
VDHPRTSDALHWSSLVKPIHNYSHSGETINTIEYVDGDDMCHKQAGLHSSKCFAHILTIDKATESVIQEPKHTDRAENPAEKTEGQAATISSAEDPESETLSGNIGSAAVTGSTAATGLATTTAFATTSSSVATSWSSSVSQATIHPSFPN